MSSSTIKFSEALACIETMPLDDQAALLDVMNKRLGPRDARKFYTKSQKPAPTTPTAKLNAAHPPR